MRQIFRTLTVAQALAGALILACCLSPAAAQRSAKHLPFLIGATWSDEMSPAAQNLFLESGCNYVRLPGGGFEWTTVRDKRQLAELRGHGIYTMLQLGSHWPDGAYEEHPDWFLVDQDGKTGTIVPGRGVAYDNTGDAFWPQYSYASAGFRAKLTTDFTSYLNAVGHDPSVVSLLCHNEPGYHWLEKRLFDYNPSAIAAFRRWLPSQYANIAELNDRWGSHYSSFAEVEPSHAIPPVPNIASFMDWRRFNADLIRNFLIWERNLAHRLCPNLLITTNLSGPLDNFYAIRAGDNYRYTQPFDSGAVDIYAGDFTNRFYVGYAMDMTRGAAGKHPTMVPECEPYDPQDFPNLTDAQRGQRLRSDLWGYAGHGAKGVLIWTWATNNMPVTTGEFNDRVKAVRDVAYQSKMLDLGDFADPPRRVAIVTDTDAWLYYGGIDPGVQGGQWCTDSLRGIYAALRAEGYQVDIISADQVRAGDADHYRALVLANQAISDASLAKSLSAYVERGGLVVAQAPFAQFDRWGKPISPAVDDLQKLFGIRTIAPYDQSDSPAIAALGFKGSGRTQLRLSGAEALASFADGFPAVTQVSRGRGNAILIASDVGAINVDDEQPALGRFLASVIKKYAGFRPRTLAETDGYLDADSLFDADGNQIVVVTDPSEKSLAPVARKDVDVVLRAVAPGGRLFIFNPTVGAGGRAGAGPLPAKLPMPANGLTRIRLASVGSACVLLIARDHAPLFRIDGPANCVAGSTVQVRVTCYNPSPRTVSGFISLDVPSGWQQVSSATPVTIAARGDKRVSLSASVGTAPGRASVKAAFTPLHGGIDIDSIPIDVMVGG